MESYPTVAYEAAALDYERDLFDVLRGHKSLECLEMWVPDADPVQNLLNLVEAADSAELPQIAVRLAPQTVAVLDPRALGSQSAALGTLAYRPQDNVYERPPSASWLAIGDQARMAWVDRALDAALTEMGRHAGEARSLGVEPSSGRRFARKVDATINAAMALRS